MADPIDGTVSAVPSVPQARIPLWTHINYSIGTMAPSALIVFSRSFLLFFYSQVVGLDAWLAGIALTIGRVWDAVSDPLMGAISDRTRSRWGRRRPYIVLGALPLALSYVALWVPRSGGRRRHCSSIWSPPTSCSTPSLPSW